MRRNFSDRFIRGLRPAPAGKRVEYWDMRVPNFGVRITERGHKTYVLYLRWPGSRAPSRREIGDASRISLAKAREIARRWLEQVELGIDPREQQRAEEIKRQRERQTTFEVVAEAWIANIASQRKGTEVANDVRREFVARWGKRPVTSITKEDVAAAIGAKRDEGHAPQAHNLLGYARRLFDWAVHQHAYGIEISPVEKLRASKLIGERAKKRERPLSDEELREVWQAAEEAEYPYGPMFRMLIMTGQRRSEVAGACWQEFDISRRLWTIPAERMKKTTKNPKPHDVPLTEDMISLLKSLPRFDAGDWLFTATSGAGPVNSFGRAKRALDDIVARGRSKPMEPWVIHDLRHTMRTRLPKLKVDEVVSERMIAHAIPGIAGVYNHHDYLEERREAFGRWCDYLRGIMQPKVVRIRG
ncbi:site-specific integrase [Bradyrhizobium ottawaense]|uniref:DUF4102 domain-containing protein n=1 Tax=Bradyrhizobium ottawaense TaxID=931866 RepID=A0A2U8P8P1_9BRAD|nr:site-specific integrase [Bradyrhizobium ottawaense]AWL94115.1 DUF4102 domain-containing protein [Bradyrhizobium ottawaense]